MILISHRGNLNGPNVGRENSPDYIDEAIELGYDVEIDIWVGVEEGIFLGHDHPQYKVDFRWVKERLLNLWIHCKNLDAVVYFKNISHPFNFFWHQKDDITLTSLQYIWAYPGKQPIKNSIAVMPEINNDNLNECIGVCSDYIEKHKLCNIY